MDESYLEWLQVLPGFSAEKARKVARRFPTYEHLRHATHEELASVEGLSPRDLEALHHLTHDSRGRDAEGHLFLCPECGSFAGPASTECPFCGVSFQEAEEAANVQEIDAFLQEEEAAFLLCVTCGATMPRGAGRCDICGRAYTPQEIALLPGFDPETGASERLCPHCGAYLAPGALECAICGVERAKAPEAAPKPTNGRNGHGLAEGFLSRWQKVAEAVPVTEMERLQEEVEQYDRILEADASLEKIWAKRGRALAKMGRGAEAAESLSRAAELEPRKDSEYRLEVLDILGAKGDRSFLPRRWQQPRATASPASVDPRLVDALHHYDALLDQDPQLVVAWRTKGEILERLGRGDEARVCFERADILERHEDDLLKARVAGLQAPGLTSAPLARAGHTNGRTNGRTTGRVNGVAEGRVNGLTNGAATGMGLTHGATNGLGGFTNGRTNGLVNGNGFTNGRRGRYGPSRLPDQPHWARSLVGIAAVIALMVLVPVLASILSPAPGSYAPIAIDHNFSEWNAYAAYVNVPAGTMNNPDINLLEVKVATDPSNLYVYAKSQGLFFQAGWTNGTESVFVFVDQDRSAATGYPVGGMGADLLAVVTGWDGQIQSSPLYAFNESGLARSNDFRRFVPAGSVSAAFLGDQFEVRIPMDTNPAAARVLVYGVDNRGNQDAMVGLIQPGRPTVVVAQSTVAPGVITNTTAPILSVSLSPLGGVPSVTGLNLTRRGSSTDPVTVAVYRDSGTGSFSPQAPLLGSAVLSGSRAGVPLTLSLPAPAQLWITATWANMTPTQTFGLLVTNVAGNGTASFRPADTTLDYQIAAPSTPTVDGAFADWANHSYGSDLLGDVVNPSGPMTYDANIDLLATAVDVRANFTGYAQVAGYMLGGQDIPVDVLRPGPYTPPANTTPPPAPYVPETGFDVLYAYIDSDNSSLTGIRAQVGNRTYGFDYVVTILGRNGQVNASALYRAGANNTWQYVGPAVAATDSHRLEFAVNASTIQLRVGYQVVYYAKDWELQYDVALPTQNVATFSLSAFAKGSGGKPKPPPPNPPVINLVKTVSASTAQPGDSLTYLLYFNNTAPGIAKTVSITDVLPSSVTYLRASTAPSSVSGSTYAWTFANVGGFTTNVLQITVQVNGVGTDGALETNTASISYTDVHGNLAGTGSSSASFTYERPVITVAKTVSPANAVAGQQVTYTIYFNNTGSAPAANVSIVDTMPSGLANISYSTQPTAASGLTTYWNFTTVAPGSHSITITAQVSPTVNGTQLVNSVSLSYTSVPGYQLPGSSSSAIVAIPELSDFAFVAAVPFLVIGLRRRARRRKDREEQER